MIPVKISGAGAAITMMKYRAKLERHPGDAGIDLYPMIGNGSELRIEDFGVYYSVIIPTQTHIEIPAGMIGFINGRSSSGKKLLGCSVVTAVIDHGYTGEYMIVMRMPKLGGLTPTNLIDLGERIERYCCEQVALAQLLLLPFYQVRFQLVDRLPESARGVNGYGSTDTLQKVMLDHSMPVHLSE